MAKKRRRKKVIVQGMEYESKNVRRLGGTKHALGKSKLLGMKIKK